jgi:hypothetical protein
VLFDKPSYCVCMCLNSNFNSVGTCSFGSHPTASHSSQSTISLLSSHQRLQQISSMQGGSGLNNQSGSYNAGIASLPSVGSQFSSTMSGSLTSKGLSPHRPVRYYNEANASDSLLKGAAGKMATYGVFGTGVGSEEGTGDERQEDSDDLDENASDVERYSSHRQGDEEEHFLAQSFDASTKLPLLPAQSISAHNSRPPSQQSSTPQIVVHVHLPPPVMVAAHEQQQLLSEVSIFLVLIVLDIGSGYYNIFLSFAVSIVVSMEQPPDREYEYMVEPRDLVPSTATRPVPSVPFETSGLPSMGISIFISPSLEDQDSSASSQPTPSRDSTSSPFQFSSSWTATVSCPRATYARGVPRPRPCSFFDTNSPSSQQSSNNTPVSSYSWSPSPAFHTSGGASTQPMQASSFSQRYGSLSPAVQWSPSLLLANAPTAIAERRNSLGADAMVSEP